MKEPAPEVVVAGKYCLEGQLASGGMGSVWVARHLDLDVPVAIKFMGIECSSSEEGRIRFEREAKAAAFLQSPHVVNVQDYGVDEGLAYIVMELLTGEDLKDRIHKKDRLTLEETLTVLAQTSKALRRAQELGIVHRDIKPENLFLAQGPDGEEIVKVLDFGIAKETGPVLLAKGTNTGQIIGSPHYMSPEAVRGARDIDFRSDLWSLGVIVFECVTGRLPFASDNVGDVMGMILADPLPSATAIAPDLPPAIDAFFEKALARDRNQRFQSAKEMTDAFAELVRSPDAPRHSFQSDPTPGPRSLRAPKTSPDTDTQPAISAVAPAPPPSKARIAAGVALIAVIGVLLVLIGLNWRQPPGGNATAATQGSEATTAPAVTASPSTAATTTAAPQPSVASTAASTGEPAGSSAAGDRSGGGSDRAPQASRQQPSGKGATTAAPKASDTSSKPKPKWGF